MSEQDAVERLDEIRERAKYLKKYGERELYYYNPQEHKDLFFLLDRLEASQQENERLRGEYRRYLAFIVDFTTHYHRLTKSQRNAQIMQLRKDAKEKLAAALEEQEAQDEQ